MAFQPIDQLGQPTVPACSDHYSHMVLSVRPYVSTFQNLAKQNKSRVKIMIAAGETVGLAKGIIDETQVLYRNFILSCKMLLAILKRVKFLLPIFS